MSAAVPVVVLGAGGHAREIADVVLACAAAGQPLQLLGYLDDDARKHGSTIHAGVVLGDLSWLDGPGRDEVCLVSGIGSPAARRRVVAAAQARGRRFVTLVHPHAQRTDEVTLGEGVVVTAGCVLTHAIRIGAHTHVNRCTTIGHDCVVGAFVHLAPGVVLSGNVTIEDDCDVGTHATVIQGLTVGRGSIVGAGAVVVRSLPPQCTAVGVPARVIKQR
ncbi:MAG: acetyltransferase [Nannocystaceae bacterium]|nr:acetyltransferase [Nannocystaceae bacterium]